MLFPKYVTHSLFQEIRNQYPDTTTNSDLLRFIMYLSLGTRKDKRYDLKPISQKICSILQEVNLNGHYSSQIFLNKMVGYLPDLKIVDYIMGDKCRLIENDGLSDNFKQFIKKEIVIMLRTPKEELIHYRTGSKYNRKRSKKELETECLDFAESYTKKASTVDLQIKFLNYFNSLNTNDFTNLLKYNLEDTISFVETFNFKNDEVKESNIKLLNVIKLQPKPFYYAVDNSSRLYCEGSSSLTALKREVRKVFTKGWVDFDIVNCHLAIMAKEWSIPSLTNLLKSKTNFWKYLDGYVPQASGEKKHILKKVIYGLVYGDSKKNMIDFLKSNGLKNANNFFKNIPIIRDIYEARQIELNKPLIMPTDCFGKQLNIKERKHVHDKAPERSILAQKAQAIELKMLEPIIDFSIKNNSFVAALYQYDGFSCIPRKKDRADSECRKLKKLLDTHIVGMGYDTCLEYTINGSE